MNSKSVLKSTSLLLSFVLLVTSTSFATDDRISNFSRVVIENEVYIFSDALDENGNTQTIIANLTTKETDVLTMNDDATAFYLNGELIATISKTNNVLGQTNPFSKIKAGGFTYIGSSTQRITWLKGTTVAVVAGVIAAAVGMGIATLGVSAVIATIGLGALSILAAQSTGGSLATSVYQLAGGTITTYKFVWRFTASTGDSYGSYTSYTTV